MKTQDTYEKFQSNKIDDHKASSGRESGVSRGQSNATSMNTTVINKEIAKPAPESEESSIYDIVKEEFKTLNEITINNDDKFSCLVNLKKRKKQIRSPKRGTVKIKNVSKAQQPMMMNFNHLQKFW